MLDDSDKNKIDKAVAQLKVSEIIDEAKKLGITVTSPNRGYHRIKNNRGEYEKLDIDKYFKGDG